MFAVPGRLFHGLTFDRHACPPALYGTVIYLSSWCCCDVLPLPSWVYECLLWGFSYNPSYPWCFLVFLGVYIDLLSPFARNWSLWAEVRSFGLLLREGGRGILRHTDSLQRQCPTTSSPPSRAMQLQQGFRSSSSSKKGLLDSRAIEEVADTSSLNYYSLFLVTKPDGSFCPIINLKKLNLFLEIPSFKMETLFSIIAALQP